MLRLPFANHAARKTTRDSLAPSFWHSAIAEHAFSPSLPPPATTCLKQLLAVRTRTAAGGVRTLAGDAHFNDIASRKTPVPVPFFTKRTNTARAAHYLLSHSPAHASPAQYSCRIFVWFQNLTVRGTALHSYRRYRHTPYGATVACSRHLSPSPSTLLGEPAAWRVGILSLLYTCSIQTTPHRGIDRHRGVQATMVTDGTLPHLAATFLICSLVRCL